MKTIRRWLDRLELTTVRACQEFVEDRAHRDAAQIAFFALLSFIPLTLLLVAAFGLVLDEAEVRERVIDTVFDHIPLAREADRAKLEQTVGEALDSAGSLGPASIVLLLVAATGIMGALRHAINEAWDIHSRPPLLWRKLLDLALVLVGTVVLAHRRAARPHRRRAPVRPHRPRRPVPVPRAARSAPEDARDLARRGRRRAAARGRARRLELYFEDLSDFGALYGSLGAMMALLVFVFAAANVLCFGAEFASEWSRLPPPDETRSIVARGHARLRRALPI